MKPLSAPRQPFVGLALMAAVGIIAAEIVPLGPTALISAAVVVGICILIAVRWPRLALTYLIVAAGFFLRHKFATTNTVGQQLAAQLGERPRVVTVVGCVITEPKIAPSGFATFLLKLKSIELEGKNESTHAVWQVRWKGAPEFGDDGGNPILRAAQASRTWMQNALCRGLEDAPEVKNFISGIVLGIRHDTPEDIEEPFQQTGTIHLFAVAGLHVGIMAALLWVLAAIARLSRKRAAAFIIPS